MAEQKQIPMPVNRLTVPRTVSAAASAALTPKDVIGILRRHVLLMVSLTILGFLVGGASWYLLMRYSPKYTTQTFIRVLPFVEKDPMIIGAAQVNKDIQYGSRLSIAALITEQNTLMELLGRYKVQETAWFKSFGDIKDVRIKKAFKDLKKHLGVYANRDSEFVSVSMTCADKQESALIVNELVSMFLDSYGSTKKKEVSDKLTGLNQEFDRVQRDLDTAESALKAVRDTTGITDLQERNYADTATLRLNDLTIEQNSLVLEIDQQITDITSLERQATGPVNVQVENLIERDPTMTLLAQQLAFQESSLSGLLTKFGENHRVVRQEKELINEIRQRRELRKGEFAEQTRQSNLKNAQDRLISLRSKYEQMDRLRVDAEAKKKDLDLARVQYEQRLAVKDERKKMLDSIKESIEKQNIIHEDPETPKVQFVGLAPVPIEISSPRWEIYFPGGTFLGFLFGVGLAFLIELLNDLVRTPRDVGRFLHIPLLGVIPDAQEDDQVGELDLCHVVRLAPYSIIAESYRRLRTNLKLSASADSSKALLVSSGMPADGKTSVAVNLATTFIAEDKKVLLIDANFWRPVLHTTFPRPASESGELAPPELGLSALLTGLCGYQEVIRPSGVEGLDIIDSGPFPSRPAELLGGARMQELIKRQREKYDYVIVDGPPLLLVSDSKVLARFVDSTILVFNAGATKRGAALRTIRELKEINAPIIGCVLVAVKSLKGGYFQEQFRSYEKYRKLQFELAHSTS